MDAHFRFDGDKELQAVLNDLPGTTARASARRMLKIAGWIIAEAAAALAPVRLGYLRDSYTVSTRLTARQRKLARRDPRSQVEVYVGPGEKGYTAGVQTEFGNRHQAAEPHLRPAFDAKWREAVAEVGLLWWADIEKTVARHRRKLARQARR